MEQSLGALFCVCAAAATTHARWAAAADWLRSPAISAAWLASGDGILKTLPLRLSAESKGARVPREACIKKVKVSGEASTGEVIFMATRCKQHNNSPLTE